MYNDEITFEQLSALVERPNAASFRLLKPQIDEEYIEELADL